MTNTALSRVDAAEIMERVITTGDLAKLSPQDRVQYYARICESVGLNPLTRPFEYITLNGKLTLYARKDATDQLRKLYGVSLAIVGRDRLEDVYIVTARATMPDGRTDESTGVVSLGNLRGDPLANALMKAETKAKRRVTLSICGLGWLDETETQTIPDARPVRVDAATGEIHDAATAPDTTLLINELRTVRKELHTLGGALDERTIGQMREMTPAELELEINRTRHRLEDEKVRLAAEARQHEATGS